MSHTYRFLAMAFTVPATALFLCPRISAAEPAATTVSLSPESVPFAERNQVRDFTIRVHLAQHPTTAPTVQLTLDTGRGDPRRFAAVADSDSPTDVFRVSAPLIPEYLHPQRLRVVATYANGSVSCTIQDTELEVGSRTVMLSQIRKAECGKKIRLTLATGETLQAPPTGLQNLRGDLGPVTLTLNLASAQSFTVQPLHPSLASVAYKIEVKDGDAVVAERSGEIPVQQTASGPTSAP